MSDRVKNCWLIVFSAIVILYCNSQGEKGKISSEVQKNIRMFDSTSFEYPIVLKEVFDWRDGGSWGFEMFDNSQKQIHFCEDNRNNSKTAGRLFFGATYPRNKGAILVKSKSDEKILLSALQNAVESGVTIEQSERIEEYSTAVDNKTLKELMLSPPDIKLTRLEHYFMWSIEFLEKRGIRAKKKFSKKSKHSHNKKMHGTGKPPVPQSDTGQ